MFVGHDNMPGTVQALTMLTVGHVLHNLQHLSMSSEQRCNVLVRGSWMYLYNLLIMYSLVEVIFLFRQTNCGNLCKLVRPRTWDTTDWPCTGAEKQGTARDTVIVVPSYHRVRALSPFKFTAD